MVEYSPRMGEVVDDKIMKIAREGMRIARSLSRAAHNQEQTRTHQRPQEPEGQNARPQETRQVMGVGNLGELYR